MRHPPRPVLDRMDTGWLRRLDLEIVSRSVPLALEGYREYIRQVAGYLSPD